MCKVEKEGAQLFGLTERGDPWEDLEMTVVSLSLPWGGKDRSGITKVKPKQKAVSATPELTESTQSVGSSSDFPV